MIFSQSTSISLLRLIKGVKLGDETQLKLLFSKIDDLFPLKHLSLNRINTSGIE